MLRILLFLVTALVIASANDSTKLMTEIFPPYQFKNDNGELVGISVEIVQAIQKEVGNTSNIKVYPWVRGLKIVSKKKGFALFSTMRTPEREKEFKWVGPIQKLELVFFKRYDSPLTIHSFADAKKVRKVGVPRDVANHKLLLKEGFTNLDVSASGGDDIVMKKLLHGRVDLVPTIRSATLYNLKRQGYSGKAVPIDTFKIFEGALYIAFHKDTSDTIIKAWQKALDKLKKEKVIEEIIRRYQ